MARQSKKYYRDNAKKNREIDKQLSKQYRNFESRPGETFSQYRKRIKKSLG
jgi:hypothetical protein